MDDLKIFLNDAAPRGPNTRHRAASDGDGAQFQSEFDGLERGNTRANAEDRAPAPDVRAPSPGKDTRRPESEDEPLTNPDETEPDAFETDEHHVAPTAPEEPSDTPRLHVVPVTDGPLASTIGAAQTVLADPAPAADEPATPDADVPGTLTSPVAKPDTTGAGTPLSVTTTRTASPLATPSASTATNDTSAPPERATEITGAAQASAEGATPNVRLGSPAQVPGPDVARADTGATLPVPAPSRSRAMSIDATAAPTSVAAEADTPAASPTTPGSATNVVSTTNDTLSVAVSRSDTGTATDAKTEPSAKGVANTATAIPATDGKPVLTTPAELPKSQPVPAPTAQAAPAEPTPRIMVSTGTPAAAFPTIALYQESAKPNEAGRRAQEAWALDPPSSEKISAAPPQGWTANAHAAQAARLTDRMNTAAWTVALGQAHAEREAQTGLFAIDELAFSATGALQTASMPGVTAPATAMPSIAQQIAAALVDPRNDKSGPIDVALDPPELGRVRLSVTEVNGAIMLSITADRPETADLMRRHVALLMEEFARSGLDAPSVDISGGDRGPRDQAASATDRVNRGDTTSPEGQAASEVPAQRPTPRNGQGDLDLRL